MIPNVTKGDGMRDVMVYLVTTDPEKTKNVHTEPHLVAGDATVTAWFGDDELDVAAAGEIARVLNQPWKTYQVDVPGGHVWHGSLSIRAEEGRLGDEKWRAIAERFAEKMGFDGSDGKAPCRWVAVHHGLSKSGNDHIHFVADRVREDGTKWNAWNDFRRAQEACRELEALGVAVS